MKANRILLLCTALVLPQLAMADVADTNPQGLGDIQALLKFCARVDPRDAAAFQQQWASIVGTTTGKQINVVEDESGFKQGSDATTKVLDKLSKSTAAGICADTAARWDGKVSKLPVKEPDDRNARRPDPLRNDRR